MTTPTVLAITSVKGPFDAVTATCFNYAYAASTGADGDTFQCTGRELLMCYNGTGGALTITVTSVVDEQSRTGDVAAYSVGAGLYSCIPVGLTNSPGWKAAAGTIRITTSAVGLTVAVLRLPAGYP